MRAGYWKRWLGVAVAAGWLLLVASISFVPKLRRPAGEQPTWKLVVWLVLFFMVVSFVAFIWKGG